MTARIGHNSLPTEPDTIERESVRGNTVSDPFSEPLDTKVDANGVAQPGTHEVVVIQGDGYQSANTTIYDPSFGLKYPGATLGQAEQAWEDKMLNRFDLILHGPGGNQLGGQLAHVNGARQTVFSF